MSRLTGERPIQGVTPDSLLALHDAGYRAVLDRLGDGKLLDLGCGQGFESVRLIGPGRCVVGVDYSAEALEDASRLHAGAGLQFARTDALSLCIGDETFDYACSSHLIEHFERPEGHVSEMARVLKPGGEALILTPNAPADFENPFHVHPFDAAELTSLLVRYFSDVWVGALDATREVKDDFRSRRERAAKVLRLDFLDLRHRIPLVVRRRLHQGAATRLPGHGQARHGREHGDHGRRLLRGRRDRRIHSRSLRHRTQPQAVSTGDPRVVTVGLTGGIGSGKSTVAGILERKGASLIDADAIAREVVAPGGPSYGPVVERFGESVLAADGTIDRKALASVVFSDPLALADLNSLMHPEIGKIMASRRQAADELGGVVVMDIPLMKATHRDQLRFDVIVVVDVPVELAVERLVAQRGFDRADAEARVANQISREERSKLADVVVDNSTDRRRLEEQVEQLWADLEAKVR